MTRPSKLDELRRLVIERRDLLADLCAVRLSMIDAEAVGLDTSEAAARIRALEDRDRELSYAQRQASVALAGGGRYEDVSLETIAVEIR